MRLRARIAAALKALTLNFSSGSSPWGAYFPGTAFNYAGRVGDGTNSSAVMAPLLWISRTFPEAPLKLDRIKRDGQLEPVLRHPMPSLVRRPNNHYSGTELWRATVIDYNVDGNAYWLKIRDRTGTVIALWWAPYWTIEPKPKVGDPESFIDHYEYRAGGHVAKIPPNDVVHFRFGLDPDNPRRGLSPLRSVLREVFTDDEAATFTASLLRNSGVPGLVISPDPAAGDSYTITPDDSERIESRIASKVGGDERGRTLVFSAPTKIEQFGFSPEQLVLRDLRRIPEERITAALGVPAVVAGLGAGLDRSTFTNMGEAREMAYESNIIPTQSALADQLHHQLLPDFEPRPESFELCFDLSQVRVLQEDENARSTRLNAELLAGGRTRAEWRRERGLPVDEALDNVFYIPTNVAVVVPGEEPEPAPEPPTNGAVPAIDAEAVLAAANGGSE